MIWIQTARDLRDALWISMEHEDISPEDKLKGKLRKGKIMI